MLPFVVVVFPKRRSHHTPQVLHQYGFLNHIISNSTVMDLEIHRL
ncbi:hypothetical protein J599_2065 [Acinetobacter baumannii 1598530]|nr:hypothetical protein J599_2065 [Acinetobacter baumannii 1598530]